jgi:hypothetical protein
VDSRAPLGTRTHRQRSGRRRARRPSPRRRWQPRQVRMRRRLCRRRSRPLQAAWLSLPGQVPWSPRDLGHCQGHRSRRWVAYPHQDQLRRVSRSDDDTALGAVHVGGSSVRQRRLLRGSTDARCPHCCRSTRDAVLVFQEADYQGGLGHHRCGTHR